MNNKYLLSILYILCIKADIILAQNCACDYYIPLDQEEVWLVKHPSPHKHQKYWPLKKNGETTVCIMAGIRNRLYIRDFKSEDTLKARNYVFKNCGGQVEIKAPDSDGIVFYNCEGIKLSGTGSENTTYGIKISQTRWTGTNYGNGFGISIQGYSRRIEIEKVEILNTGFSAICAKTDNGKYDKEGNEFVLDDCSFHDNYIHDLLKGEGFYIGHNSWSLLSNQHSLNRIYIYNNRLENIPWDAVQIGGTRNAKTGVPAEAEIYGNTIINYGTDTNAIDLWQNNGINLSGGFSGRCYNNFIKNGLATAKGNGIITGGVGDVHIFNNTIVEPAEAGIFITNSTAERDKSFYIYNNTIVCPGSVGIDYRVPGNKSTGYFVNNLVVSGKGLKSVCSSCELNTITNYFEKEMPDSNFINVSQLDYRLKDSGLYKGTDLSGPLYHLEGKKSIGVFK